jgi:hypothetical protein
VIPNIWFNYYRGDGGRSSSFSMSPSLDFRVGSGWTASLGVSYSRNTDDRQPYGNFTDDSDVTHYTFAHLEQKTYSFQARLNYTASPTLTVQAYAAPFISHGTYSAVRELSATPRAASYEDRFQVYPDPEIQADPGTFNFKQFNSNVVLRWEYRPGSALFLVWQQGRSDDRVYDDRSFRRDFSRLFDAHPDNTFLVKLSYWFDR